MRWIWIIGSALAVAAGCQQGVDEVAFEGAPESGPQCTMAEQDEMFELYYERLTEGQSSCEKCHASPEDGGTAVNLSMWVKQSPCHTMACMVEKQLVNFQDPAASRIIEFIEFGVPEDGSVDMQVQRELDGVMSWIKYGQECYASCGEIVDPCGEIKTSGSGGSGGGTTSGGSGGGTTSGGSGGGGTTGDGGIWGGCYKVDVEAQFKQLVWPTIETGCKSCHGKIDPDFMDAGQWIFEGNPDGSLPEFVNFGLFDTLQPDKSTILSKPLHQDQAWSDVFNAMVVGVTHDGGQKLSPAGPQFKQRFDDIATFILYFDACHE